MRTATLEEDDSSAVPVLRRLRADRENDRRRHPEGRIETELILQPSGPILSYSLSALIDGMERLIRVSVKVWYSSDRRTEREMIVSSSR